MEFFLWICSFSLKHMASFDVRSEKYQSSNNFWITLSKIHFFFSRNKGLNLGLKKKWDRLSLLKKFKMYTLHFFFKQFLYCLIIDRERKKMIEYWSSKNSKKHDYLIDEKLIAINFARRSSAYFFFIWFLPIYAILGHGIINQFWRTLSDRCKLAQTNISERCPFLLQYEITRKWIAHDSKGLIRARIFKRGTVRDTRFYRNHGWGAAAAGQNRGKWSRGGRRNCKRDYYSHLIKF